MSKEMSPERWSLAIDTAKRVRAAIDEREREMHKQVVDYEKAVASGNKEEIQAQAVMLVVVAAIMDPVRDALKDFSRLDKLLRDAQGPDAPPDPTTAGRLA